MLRDGSERNNAKEDQNTDKHWEKEVDVAGERRNSPEASTNRTTSVMSSMTSVSASTLADQCFLRMPRRCAAPPDWGDWRTVRAVERSLDASSSISVRIPFTVPTPVGKPSEFTYGMDR